MSNIYDCVICCDTKESDNFNTPANCQHQYHRECGDEWIATEMNANRTPLCPICKRNFLADAPPASPPSSPTADIANLFSTAEIREDMEEEQIDIVDEESNEIDAIIDQPLRCPRVPRRGVDLCEDHQNDDDHDDEPEEDDDEDVEDERGYDDDDDHEALAIRLEEMKNEMIRRDFLAQKREQDIMRFNMDMQQQMQQQMNQMQQLLMQALNGNLPAPAPAAPPAPAPVAPTVPIVNAIPTSAPNSVPQSPRSSQGGSATPSSVTSRRSSIATTIETLDDIFVGYDPEFDYVEVTEKGKVCCKAMNSRHEQCKLAVRPPSRYLCPRHMKYQATEAVRKKTEELYGKNCMLREIGNAKRDAEARLAIEAENARIMDRKMKTLEVVISNHHSQIDSDTSCLDSYLVQFDVEPMSKRSSRASSIASSRARSRENSNSPSRQ